MCGILAPWPGIKFMPPATEPRRLNHWMAREVAVISSSFSFSSLVPGESLGLDPDPSLQTPLLSQLPASLPCVNCMWSMLRAKHHLSDGATRQKQAAQFLPTWDDRPARKSKYQGDDWINGKWEVLKKYFKKREKILWEIVRETDLSRWQESLIFGDLLSGVEIYSLQEVRGREWRR